MSRIAAAFFVSSLFALLACAPPKDPVVPTLGTSSATTDPTAPPTTPTSNVEPPTPSGTLTNTPEDDLFPRVAGNGFVVFQRETLGAESSNAAVMGALLGASAELDQAVRLSPEGKVGMTPALSPDGGTLVFVSNALGPLALLKKAPNTSAPIAALLASDKAPELGEPVFSADGKQLAFTMKGAGGNRTIATINVDGTKFTTHFPGRTPAFRPDGAALVYVSRVDGYNQLFERELGAGKPERALTSGAFDCDHPSFSPDGKHLTFSSNRGFAEAKAPRETFLRVFTSKADGSEAKPVTPPEVRAATPFWASDGWIYFASSTGRSFDLSRVKP